MNVTNANIKPVSRAIQLNSIRLLMRRLNKTPDIVRRGKKINWFWQAMFWLFLDGRNLTILLPSSSPQQLEKLVAWLPLSWVDRGTTVSVRRRIIRAMSKIISNQGDQLALFYSPALPGCLQMAGWGLILQDWPGEDWEGENRHCRFTSWWEEGMTASMLS